MGKFDAFLSGLEKTQYSVEDVQNMVLGQESDFGKVNTSKPNYAGAIGPGQILPTTFESAKLKGLIPKNYDINNPEHNLATSKAIVADAYKRHEGDADKVLAEYYAGPGAIKDGMIKTEWRDLKNPKAPTVGQYIEQAKGKIEESSPEMDKFLNALKTGKVSSEAQVEQPQPEKQTYKGKPKSIAESYIVSFGKPFYSGLASLGQMAGKGLEAVGAEETGKTLGKASTTLGTEVERRAKPFMESNPTTSTIGEVTGIIFNPLNKLVPGLGGPATSLAGAVGKGAAQGAIANVIASPVLDENKPFITEKAKQAATGGLGGAAIGGLANVAGAGISKAVDAYRNTFGAKLTGPALEKSADDLLTKSGIDMNKVSADTYQHLREQAKGALQSGSKESKDAFNRVYEASTLKVPVDMLRGQATRDPMQFAVEQNLRGIQGVGEPLTQKLVAQNKALIANLDANGANLAQDAISSSHYLSNALKNADETGKQAVSNAYKAFKDSTGKSLDVPLQGMAQDYAKATKDFGDVIPGPIKSKFEELGLMSGKLKKTFSIDDAENLIKDINRRYDPMNKPQARALDDLRSAVQKAIGEAGQNETGQAGQLAKIARETAKQRFQTIDSIPALKDAVKGVEPDKFMQKHILQGKVNEIEKMSDYLKKSDPEALNQIRSDIVGLIKSKVTNNVSDENAKFSQAALKNFVTGDTGKRLSKILSPEQFAELQKLNRVAENVLYEPVASAVNRSNTTSAAANVVQGALKGGSIGDLYRLGQLAPELSGVPAASRYLAGKQQVRLSQGLVNEAINPFAQQANRTPINLMTKPGVLGAGLLTQNVRQRNKE